MRVSPVSCPAGRRINVGTVKAPNTLGVNVTDPVVSYEIDGVTFYFAPVLVCKEPGVLVGLSDAISASALPVGL